MNEILYILMFASVILTCWERQRYLAMGLADPNSRDDMIVVCCKDACAVEKNRKRIVYWVSCSSSSFRQTYRVGFDIPKQTKFINFLHNVESVRSEVVFSANTSDRLFKRMSGHNCISKHPKIVFHTNCCERTTRSDGVWKRSRGNSNWEEETVGKCPIYTRTFSWEVC